MSCYTYPNRLLPYQGNPRLDESTGTFGRACNTRPLGSVLLPGAEDLKLWTVRYIVVKL